MTDDLPPQLSYRADLDLLTVRWFADSALPRLRAEYEAALAAGTAHGTGRWLFDVRRRPAPGPDAAQWVTFDWLPRAAAAQAPRRLRLAYLVSPLRTDLLRTDPALHAAVEEILATPHSYDLRLFADEGEAVRWLTA